MTLNTIVLDPKEIQSLDEVKKYLRDLTAYEREKKCKAGVLLIQRRQFDALYYILPVERAVAELNKPITQSTPEFGIKFYPTSYFLALHERLSGHDNYPLPEPLSRP